MHKAVLMTLQRVVAFIAVASAVLLLGVYTDDASAQSKLKKCKSSEHLWDNCFGQMTDVNGWVYEGEWRNNERHGQGTQTSRSGDKYVGEFKHGKWHGQGIYTSPDGHKYVGEFRDNLYTGRGTFTDKDGKRYVGQFKYDQFNGRGIIYARDGSIIEQGIYAYGKLIKAEQVAEQQISTSNGGGAVAEAPKTNKPPACPKDKSPTSFDNCFGEYNYGYSTYVGDWKNGEKHGQGSLMSFGTKYIGEWRNDKKHGQGYYDGGYGYTYTGQWLHDRRHGEGTATWANGDRYIGDWKYGSQNGKGTYIFADGRREEGEWRDNRLHGHGVRYDAAGKVIQRGVFESGTIVRKDTSVEQLDAKSERLSEEGPAAAANDNQRKIALVIGNNRYRKIPSLDNPVNDATDMAASLHSLGFDVIKALDADRREMENALAKFAKQARSSDVALVFYAGHGIQHEGVNYLIPTDGQLTDETDLRRFIKLRSVIDDLENSKGARILIIDACRDNEALTRFAGSLPRTRSLAFGKGLAEESAEGVLIAYATQPGKVAVDEVGGRNSPFTAAILKHIKSPDTDIRVMFSRVRKDVLEATDFKQRPEVSDSMIGEFQFSRVAHKE